MKKSIRNIPNEWTLQSEKKTRHSREKNDVNKDKEREIHVACSWEDGWFNLNETKSSSVSR